MPPYFIVENEIPRAKWCIELKPLSIHREIDMYKIYGHAPFIGPDLTAKKTDA